MARSLNTPVETFFTSDDRLIANTALKDYIAEGVRPPVRVMERLRTLAESDPPSYSANLFLGTYAVVAAKNAGELVVHKGNVEGIEATALTECFPEVIKHALRVVADFESRLVS